MLTSYFVYFIDYLKQLIKGMLLNSMILPQILTRARLSVEQLGDVLSQRYSFEKCERFKSYLNNILDNTMNVCRSLRYHELAMRDEYIGKWFEYGNELGYLMYEMTKQRQVKFLIKKMITQIMKYTNYVYQQMYAKEVIASDTITNQTLMLAHLLSQ